MTIFAFSQPTWSSWPNSPDMSQAFVREGDDQWLSDVAPTVPALIHFLSRENGGVRVYEKSQHEDAQGRKVHVMSNGLSYTRNINGQWEIFE